MRKLKLNLEFDSIVSGDYKAATDGLDISYSKRALEPFIEIALSKFPELKFYFDSVRPALSEHTLHYKISDEDTEEFSNALTSKGVKFEIEYMDSQKYNIFIVEQRNGQLMGSPLSFPILCLVNLIAYWRSMELYTTKRIKFKDLPVLVNGDDILFRSNQKHYAIWKDQIKYVSFTLSLGKNYIHSTLLTVNSVMYSFSLTKELDYLYNLSLSLQTIDANFVGEWKFQLINYMNPGLLTAQSKNTMRDKTRSLPLSDLYEISVGGANDVFRAHQRFIHYNLSAIKVMTDNGKFNLFIPIHLGGLGFKIFPEVRDSIEFTVFQRRFASFLLFHIKLELKKGSFPKKYFSALVDDGLTANIDFFEKYRGTSELFLEGEFNLDASYTVFDGFKRTSGSILTQHIVVGEPELKYRLPSKSLMREFNRAVRNEEFLPYLQEIDIERIFSAPRKPSLFKRLPDVLIPKDLLYSSLIERSISTNWDGISASFSTDWKSIPLTFSTELSEEKVEFLTDYQLEVQEFFHGLYVLLYKRSFDALLGIS
jgi:hypothetical protein